jgi:hypothetical protein
MSIGGLEGNKVQKKIGHKNAIKQEKGDPLDSLTTQSTPLKIIWPRPQGPQPGFPTTVQQ